MNATGPTNRYEIQGTARLELIQDFRKSMTLKIIQNNAIFLFQILKIWSIFYKWKWGYAKVQTFLFEKIENFSHMFPWQKK